MKTATQLMLSIFILTLISCQNESGTDMNYEQSNQFAVQNPSMADQNSGFTNLNQKGVTLVSNRDLGNQSHSQGNDKIVMHTIMDSKTNQPFAQIPLPASWKINAHVQQNSPAITGPNGIEVYTYGYQSFVYSNDVYMQQSYQAAGQQMRRPVGVEGVLNQDVKKMAQQSGSKFIKQYPLSQIAQADKNYGDQLYSVGQSQTTYQAAASEWEDGKGNKAMIVVHYTENSGYGSVYWGYYIQVVGSKASDFENVKSTYLNALVNTRYNPQHIAAYNQREAAKSNQSWATHDQKMKNNQANFEAQQRAHQSSVDAWNKSSMDAYNSRSASQDRIQNQRINSINETQNVIDPNNGQSYQVEGYSNQYWMNGQGEYIPSDNSLYNPNLDENVNNQNWEEAPISPY
ncbi:hypothetical protein SAMN05216419_10336 [Nitrosomonas cryotolerans]|uniref:Lipoprotein n=1 Tax=Nitrosomonas cryotolerans ATCC 49181 TaxID=1131553 RepID=A0A1N6FXL5_9PROT|nr:hypothetical protein [Nitrosomonas cryotolerans]SFP91874.1 hypothetical protein SAMN05216419_10336 [Nitrosomonas cryotolerans]SIO00008.1 hypothetical protein SAMN02743940_0451 [Nitrosomonas cryotolerans ATCC 49181]